MINCPMVLRGKYTDGFQDFGFVHNIATDKIALRDEEHGITPAGSC